MICSTLVNTQRERERERQTQTQTQTDRQTAFDQLYDKLSQLS